MECRKFKILGTSDAIETCEHCGKDHLKRGAVLGVLDEGGAVIGEMNVGLTCASNLTGNSSTGIARSARIADSVSWVASFGVWRLSGDMRSFKGKHSLGIDMPEKGCPATFTSLDEIRPGLAANLEKVIEKARARALEVEKKRRR